MPEERAYWRCHAITALGERCRAYALPHCRTCVKHLPVTDPRRIRHFADQRRRIKRYWHQRRLAEAIAATATAKAA